MSASIRKFVMGYNFAMGGFGFGVLLGLGELRPGLFIVSSLNLLFAMHMLSQYEKKEGPTDESPDKAA